MNHVSTFNENSDKYELLRPQYPEQLYGYLADLCEQREIVWDCACGTGQASRRLIDYFPQVEATDINKNQICNAFKHKPIALI